MADIIVEVIHTAAADQVAALTRLLPQVSSRAARLTSERVALVVSNPNTSILVATGNREVVGMALLVRCTTLAGDFGLVEEVAVDESARGQHVGVHLMVRLLGLARELGLSFVDLTSRPSREVANGLYQSLGFQLRETNCYRHYLTDSPPLR
jgi:ribosomal protein S18 acetylase RimI-like enzyme